MQPDSATIQRVTLTRNCVACGEAFDTSRGIIDWPGRPEGLVVIPAAAYCDQCADDARLEAARQQDRVRAFEAKRAGSVVEAAADAERRRLDTAVPRRYQGATIADLPERYRNAFSSYGAAPRSVYLHGLQGRGKTHMAAALVRSVLDAQPTIRPVWANAPMMLDRVRRSINQPERAETIIEDLASAPLAVLDDVGAEKPSKWVLDRLYVVVNERYELDLPTIFTSNLALSKLDEHWAECGGARIISRIREMGAVVAVQGEDRRLAS